MRSDAQLKAIALFQNQSQMILNQFFPYKQGSPNLTKNRGIASIYVMVIAVRISRMKFDLLEKFVADALTTVDPCSVCEPDLTKRVLAIATLIRMAQTIAPFAVQHLDHCTLVQLLREHQNGFASAFDGWLAANTEGEEWPRGTLANAVSESTASDPVRLSQRYVGKQPKQPIRRLMTTQARYFKSSRPAIPAAA